MESFDNQRKVLLTCDKQYLERLDYSYLGLVFYYLFIIIICVSFQFELDWIIHKDSTLFNPIQVIISTGNFIFISTFLIFRFQHGTEFNNTFQELEITIDHLQDTVDDLMTMYDTFFLTKKKYIFKRFSTHGLLVKKIKLISSDYINDKITYQGILYQEHEKIKLRKEILITMKESFEKLKISVQTDYKLHKYKFMNFIEVDVNQFLFTIILGIGTSLPQIIPKIIQFYQ